jgi:hypothetical protein
MSRRDWIVLDCHIWERFHEASHEVFQYFVIWGIQSIEKVGFLKSRSCGVNINHWLRGDRWHWIRESRSYRSRGSKCGVSEVSQSHIRG